MTNIVKLPQVDTKGNISIEEAISKRMSVRKFKDTKLSLYQLAQLLWSGQGLINNGLSRTIPSAGATYPLELYIVIGNNSVENIEAGLYHYNPENHSLNMLISDDLRYKLSIAALHQDFITHAPISIIICASFIRTTRRYGERGVRYVYMEVGHTGQNITLQAISLGLGSVMVGAFNDEQVIEVLSLEGQIKPLYIIPIGIPA